MAHTKQTARKNSGGKPLAMGKPKVDPKPGGRADRKVIIEFSSNESYPGFNSNSYNTVNPELTVAVHNILQEALMQDL